MSPWRTFLIAISALMRTKARSFLTVLGVIIGVGAVIAMVSIGEGAKARVAQTFSSMGTDMLVVASGASNQGGARGGAGSQPTLTWDDLSALASAPGVAAVAPQLRSNAQVVGELGNWQTQVVGTSPEYFTIRNWKLAEGEIFSDADNRSGQAVAILGKTVADNLFGEGVDPIGQTIRINRIPFRVVGLAASKGTSAFGGDNDDTVIVPSTAFARRISGGLGKYLSGQILVQATPGGTSATQVVVEDLLRRRHQLRDSQDNDFSVRNMAEIAAAQNESASTITSLLAGVALVSLVVGGIGIMNIMLVSVTERTREIGLRMAVGARPLDVLSQFLIEAVVLSIAGGLIGIAAGIGAGKYMASVFGYPMLLRPDVIVLAMGVSAIVGIGFGLYPAHKASRLAPITALRYE
jgi:putative ABC transport system permease protein